MISSGLKILVLSGGLLLSLPGVAVQADALFNHAVDLQRPAADFTATVQQLKQVHWLHGLFEQRKYMQVLSRPFVSQGRMLFDAEKGLYWQIDMPVQTGYVINTRGIRAVTAKAAAKPLPMSADIGKLFTAIFAADMQVLGRLFDIYYAHTGYEHAGKSEGLWRIGLKPKRKEIERVLKSISLSGQQYIQTIVIQEFNGDSTEIVFSALSTQADSAIKDADIYLDGK